LFDAKNILETNVYTTFVYFCKANYLVISVHLLVKKCHECNLQVHFP